MKYRNIDSLDNPIIKEAHKIKGKRSRYKYNAFLIEGLHLLEGAAPSGKNELALFAVKKIFFTEDFKNRNAALLRRFSKTATELFEVPERLIKALSDTDTPQGVIAVASYSPKAFEDIDLSGVLVICDGIQEPGNLGAIIRTADAAGAGGVIILPGTCDAFEGKALRASAGSVFSVPIIYEDRAGLIDKLRKHGVRIAVTALDATLSIFDADLRVPVVFVFGNESNGASGELKRAADLYLKIPIAGRAESLNVAASAAVALFEALRQRLKP